ncbi:OB-fold domain-containing protein [Monashia sp. NPDC004114]
METVPTPEFCPGCLSEDVVEEQHEGVGVVYAATAVRRGPKGVDLPYGLAFVDLSDSLRVMARYACGDAPLPPQTSVAVTQTGAAGSVPVLTASVIAQEGAGA